VSYRIRSSLRGLLQDEANFGFGTQDGAHVFMQRLRQRADFLAAAAAVKVSTKGFILQMRDRRDDGPARVGFTVSKKVGTAVERNRIRRRLREVVRGASDATRPGRDYVLIGRRAGLSAPFSALMEDFKFAVRRLDAARGKVAGTGLRRSNTP
jgi:ribonuclease P protein component